MFLEQLSAGQWIKLEITVVHSDFIPDIPISERLESRNKIPAFTYAAGYTTAQFIYEAYIVPIMKVWAAYCQEVRSHVKRGGANMSLKLLQDPPYILGYAAHSVHCSTLFWGPDTQKQYRHLSAQPFQKTSEAACANSSGLLSSCLMCS